MHSVSHFKTNGCYTSWLARWAMALAFSTLMTIRCFGQYDPDWTRHFRLGALAGFNIKGDFRTSSSFDIPGQRGIFDDGYVIRNPKNKANDFTPNWGYQDASQYDGESTLTLHRTAGFSSSSARLRGEEDDSPYVGIDLVYGGKIWHSGWTRIGWEAGFGVLPIHISQQQRVSGQALQRAFHFDTDGIEMPPAPYEGSPDSPNNAGPQIHSNHYGSDDVGSTDATMTGSRVIDSTLYIFKLGPSAFLDLTPKWGVSVSGGAALGVLSGDYEFNDVIRTDGGVARVRGQESISETLWGWHVGAAVMYHAVPNGDFYLAAQYMPLGTATAAAKGRSADLDLSGGIFISAGINWPF